MAACLFLQRGSPNPKQTGPTESERSGRRRPLAPSFARSGDSAGLIETQSWVGAHRLAVPWTLQSARQMVLRLHLVHFQGGGAHHLMGTPLPRGCAGVAPRGLPSRLLALCHCLLCSPGPQLPCASQTASRGPHQSVWQKGQPALGKCQGMSRSWPEARPGDALSLYESLSLISRGEKQAVKGFPWQPPWAVTCLRRSKRMGLAAGCWPRPPVARAVSCSVPPRHLCLGWRPGAGGANQMHLPHHSGRDGEQPRAGQALAPTQKAGSWKNGDRDL